MQRSQGIPANEDLTGKGRIGASRLPKERTVDRAYGCIVDKTGWWWRIVSYTPPFRNTARVVSLVSEVSELVGQLTVFDGLNPNPMLRRENQVRTIHSSLLIENNALTFDQVTAVLDGKHVLAPPKDVREVQNAYEAYEAASEFDPYSFDDLLRAHALMMEGLVKHPGCLRNGDVGVYAGDVLIHAGSPASVVPKLMGELFEWLGAAEDHPLIKGSVFHYEFEFIHPFMDGNGRTGRLWHSLLLRTWRPVFAWLPIETLIHRSQAEYYDALLEAGQQADSTVFVEFMLKTIRDALQDALRQQASTPNEQINEQIIEQINQRFGDATTERQRRILAAFVLDPTLTYDSLARSIGVSSATVRRDVAELARRGLVHREGARKNGHWVVDALADEG